MMGAVVGLCGLGITTGCSAGACWRSVVFLGFTAGRWVAGCRCADAGFLFVSRKKAAGGGVGGLETCPVGG
jgi:hypothetical protein